MKKLVSIFLIFNLLICPLFAETIKIETSKGKTELVIPETQEELREAFIEMSKLYVEERYAYEDLIESQKKVQEELDNVKLNIKEQEAIIDNYIRDNNLLRTQYTDLSDDYEELIKTLDNSKKRKMFQGILGVELGFENLETKMNLMPAIELGMYIYEKVIIKTRVSYPWEVGIGLGFTF